MESEAIGTAASNADFTLMGLVFEADPIVKLVLLVLLMSSIWSWIVIGDKLFSLGGIRKKASQFEAAFWNGRTEDLDLRPGAGGDAASRVFSAAAREWADARRVSPGSGEASALVNRAERSMRATIDRELGKASRGLGVLATVGSASPFIGLFGTVWGIM
ncbi:MAG: MotA/TolQ/ExbB proton channel family protein, partial [Hyphomonas sp.]|nr:MotA/TolQ/ExbB proton channel family protein [Hyphomonas sp.]